MQKSEGAKGWFMNNSKWLQKEDRDIDRGRSALTGLCPAFPTVAQRADEKFQRRKRLEAEDIFLRTILLPEGAQGEMFEIFDGDVTLL